MKTNFPFNKSQKQLLFFLPKSNLRSAPLAIRIIQQNGNSLYHSATRRTKTYSWKQWEKCWMHKTKLWYERDKQRRIIGPLTRAKTHTHRATFSNGRSLEVQQHPYLCHIRWRANTWTSNVHASPITEKKSAMMHGIQHTKQGVNTIKAPQCCVQHYKSYLVPKRWLNSIASHLNASTCTRPASRLAALSHTSFRWRDILGYKRNRSLPRLCRWARTKSWISNAEN